MIAVGRLAPGDQWDQTLLDDLLANRLWPTGLEFDRVEGYPHAEGAILVIPGRYWSARTAEITDAIAGYRWVLAVRVGDEEDVFDIDLVAHPNLRWWVQCPRVGRDYGSARFIGVGYTPHFTATPADPPDKDLSLFLSAQCTHERRRQAFDALYDGDCWALGFAAPTEGFTKGLPPLEYTRLMREAKVAPAPSGAVSPDSFRLWEALVSHTIPIADDISPAYDSRGFWQMLLPDAPFPILTHYTDLPGYIRDMLEGWPAKANRIAAWWIGYKRSLARWLLDDLKGLGALDG